MQLICSATLVSDGQQSGSDVCVDIYTHMYILLKILFHYVIYFIYIVVCIF